MEITIGVLALLNCILFIYSCKLFFDKDRLSQMLQVNKENFKNVADKHDKLKELNAEKAATIMSLKKKIKELEANPDQSLHVLNDLMTNHKTVLEVRRIDNSEMFLRSPRGMQ
jgi:hypothetical protein